MGFLELLIFIIFVVWFGGLILNIGGGFIHILLVVIFIIIIIREVRGQGI